MTASRERGHTTDRLRDDIDRGLAVSFGYAGTREPVPGPGRCSLGASASFNVAGRSAARANAGPFFRAAVLFGRNCGQVNDC